ncbi:hypothetical protein ACFVXE_04225 [Streptomyces sp. NPDC058231]|uniref:hypothetical protein n=1 Tax=Streptomyces sp. NPDC058231 TaxID=3346392 RepID=UPI0036E70A3D
MAGFAVLATACGGGESHGEAGDARNAGGTQKAVRVSAGTNLKSVMKDTADAGKGFSLKDATSLGRYIYFAAADRYVLCFKKDVPRMKAVDLYAVPVGERCPARIGARVPAPKVPRLSGKQVEKSLLAALVAGYNPKHVKVVNVADPTKVIDPEPTAKWQVCAQEPQAGTAFDASDEVRVRVAVDCP